MDYSLYQSKLIEDNQEGFIKGCEFTLGYIQQEFRTRDTTWNFSKYNIFSVTSSNVLFYKLFQELKKQIRVYVGDDRPLWMQSWLNYHTGAEVERKLKAHTHDWDYHGYISIDPQDTTTVFHKGYEINNKIGQIYIGQGNGQGNIRPELTHYVKINTPYIGTRITIGFDVATTPNIFLGHMKFIPI